MDFVLYSTEVGYNLENIRRNYHKTLEKTKLSWGTKVVKTCYGKEIPVTFVTLNSITDLMTLTKAISNELIVHKNDIFPEGVFAGELEIYDDYRE